MSHSGYNSVLIPKYMHDFSCLGSACEDCCCKGWTVFIDHTTYKKYRRVKHPELKPQLDKYINRYRSKPNEYNYAKIIIKKNEDCPFLNEENLCGIQLKLGEQYLSKTCSVYPRCNNLVDGILEGSGTISCPEMARLVLLNPYPMEFDQVDDWPHAEYLLMRSLNSEAKTFRDSSSVKYFWPIRVFTIKVLQSKVYRLWERLLFLNIFYGKLQALVDSHEEKKIEDLIEEYNRIIGDVDTLRTVLAGIPMATNIQLKLIKLVMDLRYIHEAGINSTRYLECYHQFILGLECVEGKTWGDILLNYDNAYHNLAPWLTEHEYILENYLVNYVFKDLMPFQDGRSLLESFCMMIVNYAYIKALLIGMAAFHKTMDDKLVVKLIQSFSRTVEHNAVYINNIYDLFKKEDMFQTSYIAALIRN